MGEEVERILDRVKTIAGRDNQLPLLINHLLSLLDGFKTRWFGPTTTKTVIYSLVWHIFPPINSIVTAELFSSILAKVLGGCVEKRLSLHVILSSIGVGNIKNNL